VTKKKSLITLTLGVAPPSAGDGVFVFFFKIDLIPGAFAGLAPTVLEFEPPRKTSSSELLLLSSLVFFFRGDRRAEEV
jgi:hypothetical protein